MGTEWEWTKERTRAHVFPTHRDAEAAARANHYTDAEGKDHEAVAIVLGNPEAEKAREIRRADLIANAEASARPRRVFSGADAQSRWEEKNDERER